MRKLMLQSYHFQQRLFSLLAALLALGLTTPAAIAHEFWLEPKDFKPKVGQVVPIDIRIGQHFKGDSFPFVRAEFKRFVVIDGRNEAPVKGTDGDEPAVRTKFAKTGLMVFAHYSTPETVDFDDWAEFEEYLKYEGADHLVPRPANLKAKIKESYSRCAKLLLAVGEGEGADRFTGMPLELVAEQNPYRLKAGDTLTVQLLLAGKPLAGAQIVAFAKAEREKRPLYRTGADGRAQIALPAAGPYLLNAVHLMPATRADKADWKSLWASLTFALP
jgi:uncharacterized GH25 family protein